VPFVPFFTSVVLQAAGMHLDCPGLALLQHVMADLAAAAAAT
jgi:hypothetical protein